MIPEDIKAYEHNTPVADILSSYIPCKHNQIIPALIGDSGDASYGLLDYWAEINHTDNLSVIDAIEMSLFKTADFDVISASYTTKTLHSVLRLQNNIVIPLEWNVEF